MLLLISSYSTFFLNFFTALVSIDTHSTPEIQKLRYDNISRTTLIHLEISTLSRELYYINIKQRSIAVLIFLNKIAYQ